MKVIRQEKLLTMTKFFSNITGVEVEGIMRLRAILRAVCSGYPPDSISFQNYSHHTYHYYLISNYSWYTITPRVYKKCPITPSPQPTVYKNNIYFDIKNILPYSTTNRYVCLTSKLSGVNPNANVCCSSLCSFRLPVQW